MFSGIREARSGWASTGDEAEPGTWARYFSTMQGCLFRLGGGGSGNVSKNTVNAKTSTWFRFVYSPCIMFLYTIGKFAIE